MGLVLCPGPAVGLKKTKHVFNVLIFLQHIHDKRVASLDMPKKLTKVCVGAVGVLWIKHN